MKSTLSLALIEIESMLPLAINFLSSFLVTKSKALPGTVPIVAMPFPNQDAIVLSLILNADAPPSTPPINAPNGPPYINPPAAPAKP